MYMVTQILPADSGNLAAEEHRLRQMTVSEKAQDTWLQTSRRDIQAKRAF
ncbi:uncharacterized protein RAG0_01936 [Rhynchosporium agropyri]|uniref:Uncharacterized protein n=2 Tax=Rhynchosporium TaxID=38037 RepID=A0A1E1MFR2_RHYSE|nr:uncharacterized protein RAG0_01936 [Rhynchosporium agropyri]CZT47953.1 uncharacterized protein RSE6_08581 [Rhynchosporium secalis]